MDTGILPVNGRSYQCNKSQREDPFVVLSSIIVGKPKYVKDPFSARIHAEARHGALYRPICCFWEKWGNAMINRIGTKRRERRGAT